MSNRGDAYISKTKDYMYQDLINDPDSIYFNHTMTEVYVAAASIGFHYKKREELKSSDKKSIFVSTTIGDANQKLLWILRCIAMTVYGLDAIGDMRKTLSLCDEYANAGIDVLYAYHSGGDELNSITSKLMDIVCNNGSIAQQ